MRSIVRDILTWIILICSTTKIRNRCPFEKKLKDVCLKRFFSHSLVALPENNSSYATIFVEKLTMLWKTPDENDIRGHSQVTIERLI